MVKVPAVSLGLTSRNTGFGPPVGDGVGCATPLGPGHGGKGEDGYCRATRWLEERQMRDMDFGQRSRRLGVLPGDGAGAISRG